MKQLTMKGKNRNEVHPLTQRSKGYSENILTPVNLSGVLIPWTKLLSGGRESDYKLSCSSGFEYFIMADSEWREVLSKYSWQDIQVVGLLNLANMTIIPQKVFPKGPNGERESVIDLAAWKTRNLAKKLIKNVNDLVVIPVAVWAILAS